MEIKLPVRLTDLKVALVLVPWTTLAVLAAGYVLLEYFFGFSQAQKEPPLARSRIPYIGHTLGLLRHKMKYYMELR